MTGVKQKTRPDAYTPFYLDPPYWETEGYGVPVPWAQYELMAA